MDLLGMSFAGAVFITAVVIVRAALIDKIPKMTFIVLWEIAFVKLLVPFSVPFVFSIHTLISRLQPYSAFSGAGEGAVISEIWINGQNAAAQKMEVLSPAAPPHYSVWFIVWCIGMAGFAVFFAVSYFRCRIEFQTSLPVSDGYAEQWLKENQIRRPISVRQSDRISTPLTYGVLRPVILMPKKTDWKNTRQLQYILSHEHMHICRLDTLKKLAAAAALCVHWFNPFVWVMYILFNRDIEMACDEGVVRKFGEDSKTFYSLMLIDMEERKSGLLPFCSSFSKNATEERITAIMKMKKVTLLSFVAACLTVGGMAAAFATSAQAKNYGENKEFGGEEMNVGGVSTLFSAVKSGMTGATTKTEKKTFKMNDAVQNTEEDSSFQGTYQLKIGGLYCNSRKDGGCATVYKADFYTKDNPLLRVVTTNADGEDVGEVIIDPREIDVTNATQTEMDALNAYLLEEGMIDSTVPFGAEPDIRQNFMQALREYRDMQYRGGNLEGYIHLNKLLGVYDFWDKNRHLGGKG